MQRLLIIYNPRSSQAAEIEQEVLVPARKLSGFMVGKYEVERTDVDKNATKLAKILKDGDLVLAAGGDATATIAANGILLSSRDVSLVVLPYGNFNDLARTLKTRSFEQVFGKLQTKNAKSENVELKNAKTENVKLENVTKKLYPLEIIVDGKFFRYATCYTTIGMTAEAVEIYDRPEVRKKLKKSSGRKIGSYVSLAEWYFKNRHRKQFLPEFYLNGKLQDKRVSDYAAVNGRSMARVMKGGEDYLKPKTFRSETDRLTNFWRLFRLMFLSIVSRVPGTETKGDVLDFVKPATVEIQAEGEYRVFQDVKKIEIRKAGKWLKVVQN
jgi:hypothetical protein